jgi:hypothetical protein
MAEGSVSTFQLLLSRNEVLVQNMLASGDVAHHMCLQGFQINCFMRTDWTSKSWRGTQLLHHASSIPPLSRAVPFFDTGMSMTFGNLNGSKDPTTPRALIANHNLSRSDAHTMKAMSVCGRRAVVDCAV